MATKKLPEPSNKMQWFTFSLAKQILETKEGRTIISSIVDEQLTNKVRALEKKIEKLEQKVQNLKKGKSVKSEPVEKIQNLKEAKAIHPIKVEFEFLDNTPEPEYRAFLVKDYVRTPDD